LIALARVSIFAGLLGGVIALCTGCRRIDYVSDRLPQYAYIWQRVWNPQMEGALGQASKTFDAFAVLAGEIDLRSTPARIVRPNIDFAALKRSGVPIALAMRIDPFPGPFARDDASIEAVLSLLRDIVGQARSNQIEPAELQIDFDCGEAKLDGYRVWLQLIRAAVAPLHVVPTILPTWLKRRSFKTLARESSTFILQVHSVAVPRTVHDTETLCDANQTLKWVDQAAAIGVPFRISLPTYSYLVAFDGTGAMCGLSAEGPSTHWPPDARIVRWESDPAEISRLVAGWNHSHPRQMAALCWYRLPVPGDALNWSWKTLKAVAQGRPPRSSLGLITTGTQPAEIVAVNRGESDERLPSQVEVKWTGARLIAADALDGYRLADDKTPNVVRFELTPSGQVLRLPPDARHTVGWVRCEPATEITVAASRDSSERMDATESSPSHRH
jgi:hypothetical protein